MTEQQWLFLAPRSNETSRANFEATLASGYPMEDVKGFLTEGEQQVLYPRRNLYIWGNQVGKKGSWNRMKVGDYVAFYASKEFVYVGKCILKKQSVDIAKQLWGNVPGKDYTWEYVFFLDELRPISIPLDVVLKLSDYKENMVVQGFMPINDLGMKRLLNSYGSLTSFFDSYSTGLNSRDASTLDTIVAKEVLNTEEIEQIDRITRGRNLDLLLADWEQRKTTESPEEVEMKVKKVKRNVTLVAQMKERYENKCQVCGFTFKQINGNFYSEVAHIKPLSSKKMGVDTPSNMIVLCPNHHKMLDLGSLQIISNADYSLDGKQEKLLQPLFTTLVSDIISLQSNK
jgi:hypothetical protein